MDKQLKLFVIKSVDLSLIFKSHIMEGENQLQSWHTDMAYKHKHTRKQTILRTYK